MFDKSRRLATKKSGLKCPLWPFSFNGRHGANARTFRPIQGHAAHFKPALYIRRDFPQNPATQGKIQFAVVSPLIGNRYWFVHLARSFLGIARALMGAFLQGSGSLPLFFLLLFRFQPSPDQFIDGRRECWDVFFLLVLFNLPDQFSRKFECFSDAFLSHGCTLPTSFFHLYCILDEHQRKSVH